ncbi:MAG: Isoquinoline 1-oxidoreductase subunit [Phenylobacterium zucineum]|nr:MAG: Isoquinoline 1-oxidoreductase subunit [Phenylobacterium zucineum]
MNVKLRNATIAVVGLASVAGLAVAAAPTDRSLKRPEDFRQIADPKARSAAMFTEAGRVLQHPRCMNCHPQGRSPTQGDDLHPHVPFIAAGDGGHGSRALSCSTCHQAQNVSTQGASIATIPGHPHWTLAPASMAWQGRSLAEICAQIKDPGRNGGRTLKQIHEHMADDSLVGWAWRPGAGRTPAPGTQAAFGDLIAAWIATGAACPAS